MQSVKIIIMTFSLSLLFSMISLVGTSDSNEWTTYLVNYQNTTQTLDANNQDITNHPKDLVSTTATALLNAVEGLVNLANLVAFFIKIFLQPIIAIPLMLFTGGTTFLELFLAMISTFIIELNNFILIKELYSVLINRKVEW